MLYQQGCRNKPRRGSPPTRAWNCKRLARRLARRDLCIWQVQKAAQYFSRTVWQ